MRTITRTIIGLCALALATPCHAYLEYSGTGKVTATYKVGAVTTTTSCAAEIKLFQLYEATDNSTSAGEFAFEFTRWKFSFDEIWDPQLGTLLPPKSLSLNCLSNDWKGLGGSHADGNLTKFDWGGEFLNGFSASYTLLQGKYGATGVTNLSFKAEWWVDINAERITAIYDFPLLPRKTRSYTLDHLDLPAIKSPQYVNRPFDLWVYAVGKDDQGETRLMGDNVTVTLSDTTGTISPSTLTVTKGTGVTKVTLAKAATNVTITAKVGNVSITSNPFEVRFPELQVWVEPIQVTSGADWVVGRDSVVLVKPRWPEGAASAGASAFVDADVSLVFDPSSSPFPKQVVGPKRVRIFNQEIDPVSSVSGAVYQEYKAYKQRGFAVVFKGSAEVPLVNGKPGTHEVEAIVTPVQETASPRSFSSRELGIPFLVHLREPKHTFFQDDGSEVLFIPLALGDWKGGQQVNDTIDVATAFDKMIKRLFPLDSVTARNYRSWTFTTAITVASIDPPTTMSGKIDQARWYLYFSDLEDFRRSFGSPPGVVVGIAPLGFLPDPGLSLGGTRLLCAIVENSANVRGNLAAHEVAHLLAFPAGPGEHTPQPYGYGCLDSQRDQYIEFTEDRRNPQGCLMYADIADVTSDQRTWITAWAYNRLMNYFAQPRVGLLAGGAVSWPPIARKQPDAVSRSLSISGVILRQAGTEEVLFNAPKLLDAPPVPDSGSAGNYLIEFSASDGAVLKSLAFAPSFEPGPENTDYGVFRFELPYNPAGRSITVKKSGSKLATLSGSTHAPVISITAPAGGVLSGLIALRWQATDADGDRLTYRVLYSVDNGPRWRPLGSVADQQQLAVESTQLANGSQCRFKVIANDGFNNTEALSAVFSVANPVQVLGASPRNNALAVGVDDPVTVYFRDDMDAATLRPETFRLELGGSPVTGSVSYRSQTRVATFQPAAPLQRGTTYTAVLTTGVSDAQSHPLAAAHRWSFRTENDFCGSISPTGTTFEAGGGTGTITVTAPGSCTWTVLNHLPWVTMGSPLTGAGNGTINYSVAANPSSSARAGLIEIMGQTLSVDQKGSTGCTYAIFPTSRTHSAAAEIGSVAVNTGANCTWTVVNDLPWITIHSARSGTGSATMSYTVAANAGTARSATITVGGPVFTVTQSGAGTSGTVTELFSDQFDGSNLDTRKWIAKTSNGSGWNDGAGNVIRQTNGVLRLSQDSSDRGGAVWSQPISVSRTGLLTLTRRVKVHAEANFRNTSGLLQNAAPLAYYRYFYKYANVTDGVHFTPTLPEVVALVRDAWFDEVFTFDPATGAVTYSINGGTPIRQKFSPLTETSVQLIFDAYGWDTGHWLEIDWVKLEQVGGSGPAPVPTALKGEVYDGQGGPWTLGKSPYLVSGDITVPKGKTLTIEPGVKVRFNGTFGLDVFGTLLAPGTSSANIVFTSGQATPNPGDWKSVYFEPGSGNSVMSYCLVEYGGKDSSWGLANVCVDAVPTVTLDHLVIRRSSGDGLHIQAKAAPRISQCIIAESAYDGVYCQNASPIFTQCFIRNNADDGIDLEGSSPRFEGCVIAANGLGIRSRSKSAPVVVASEIWGHKQFGIRNEDSSTCVLARNNWWGDASGPFDDIAEVGAGCQGFNPEGRGDGVTSGVDYANWMTNSPSGPGPVHWWTFRDLADQLLRDESPYRNEGRLHGPVATDGKSCGQALRFDGVDDYAEIPHPGYLKQGTVSGWVRFVSIPTPLPSSGAEFFAISYRPIGQKYDGLTLGLGVQSRTLLFDIYSGGSKSVDSGVTPKTNQWYHFAAVWSSAGMDFFLDGEPKGHHAYTGGIPSDTKYAYLGANTWGGHASANLDEIRIYNRALTRTEIRQEMNLCSPDVAPSASVLPVSWLTQYGLALDGTADYLDSDQDGMSNWQEYQAGTHPKDRASALRLVAPPGGVLPATGNGFVLEWQSVAGVLYSVERAESLNPSPGFLTIRSNIVGQTPTTRLTDDSARGSWTYFYRVRVAPPR